MASRLPRNLAGIRQDWAVLTVYQRFEAMVALVLQAVVGLVIVVALYRLTISVVEALVLESLNPLEHTVFQRVFGQIMTLLIALEFNHTLRYVAADVRGIIQARIVIVIAILALARKAIILELSEVTPAQVAGLAGLTLALGVTYWLIRDRDDRMVGGGRRAAGELAAARKRQRPPRAQGEEALRHSSGTPTRLSTEAVLGS